MKNLIKSILIMIVGGIFIGCSSEEIQETAPIKITQETAWNQVYQYTYPKLTITALVDEVVIKDVIINRGGCKRSDKDFVINNGSMQQVSLFPRKLLYGRSMEVQVSKDCNLLDVSVITKKDSWNFNFH